MYFNENNNLEKYKSLISIWETWDKSFWTSFHVYMILNGLLFASFSQLISKINLIAYLISLFGFYINFIWISVLHRKYIHILIAENECKKMENIVFFNTNANGCFESSYKFKKGELTDISEQLGWKKIFVESKSGNRVSFVIPVIFCLVWIILAIISFFIN